MTSFISINREVCEEGFSVMSRGASRVAGAAGVALGLRAAIGADGTSSASDLREVSACKGPGGQLSLRKARAPRNPKGYPFRASLGTCTSWVSRPIENKTARAREVASNYMEHAILEQGMITSILTDNGTEFRNAKMKEIMRLLPVLETEHQYTPAYHPRGNRWLGETLRTIMNTKGLEKKEWPKLVKYLEFVYRMTPIPGTNICPFEAARGRKRGARPRRRRAV